MPAKPKLTPELQETFLRALKRTGFVAHAAQIVGVNDRTVRIWIKKGEESRREPYHSFAIEAKRARSELVEKLSMTAFRVALGDSKNGIPPDGKLAVQVLEKIAPKEWGALQRLEHSGPEGGPINHGDAVTPQKAREIMTELFGSVTPQDATELHEDDDTGPAKGAATE